MNELNDYIKAGTVLYEKIHLSTYPVAIKYIKDESEIPGTALRPSRKKMKLSICQSFTLARRAGTVVAITQEDNFCTPATAMHGWVDVPIDELIQSQVKQGWHKNEEAERRRAMRLRDYFGDLKPETYIGLICSPIQKIKFIPDTILVFGNGAQINHIIQALCYDYDLDHIPISAFEGFEESCFKGGLAPFITNRPQIVVPGMGDRAFAGIQDHEIAIGIPAELIFKVKKRLFKTGGFMNIGYPLKSLIPMNITEKLTPGFEYMREIINKHFKEK